MNNTIMAVNATNSSEPGAFINALGQIAYNIHLIKPMIPTYIHMVSSALLPIYAAAHAALSRPQSAARRKTSRKDSNEQKEEVSTKMVEIMSASDAIVLPVTAGIVLTTLYYALHYIKDGLNWFLNVYFGLFGVFSIYAFLADAFATVINFVFPSTYSVGNNLVKADASAKRFRYVPGPASFKSPFPGVLRYLPVPTALMWRLRSALTTRAIVTLHIRSIVTVQARPSLPDVVALFLAAGLSYYHTFIDKPWFLGNLLGTSFCYFSLQTTSPSSAWISTLVLSAFFCYDIWAVFYTPMMIHVAQNVTAPLMMKFPRRTGGISGLGLGDIVIPGMVMAFALQLDLHRHYLKKQAKTSDGADDSKISKPEYRPVTGGWGDRFWTKKAAQSEDLKAKYFAKTYFYATMFGYILGLIASAVAVNIFNHGQPALLYLVPGVLGALWGTALVNGELGLLWSYSETAEADEKDKKQKAKSDKTSDSKADQQKQDSESKETSLIKTNASKQDKKKAEDSEQELTPELQQISDSHLFYLAVKLAKPAKDTSSATSEPLDAIAPATEKGKGDEAVPDSEESDEDEDDAKRSATVSPRNLSTSAATPASSLRRSNRVSTAARGVGVASGIEVDEDEEKVRMAKRRRKASESLAWEGSLVPNAATCGEAREGAPLVFGAIARQKTRVGEHWAKEAQDKSLSTRLVPLSRTKSGMMRQSISEI